jgi:hypothetical protein
LAEAVSDWNFRSTCQEDSQLDRRQRSSFSQDLQNNPDVVVIVTLIKGVNYKDVCGPTGITV